MLKLIDKYKASDLHITAGSPPVMRINGKIVRMGDKLLTSEDTAMMIQSLLTNSALKERLEQEGEVDFAFSKSNLGRYRVNVFKQRNTYAAAIRVLPIDVPTMEELHLPTQILEGLADNKKGLVLVTGPTESGKTTTLAAMIDYINCNKAYHILTLEDPIEYRHKHKNSIINQREIGVDAKNYHTGLRAALRQNPDIILIGEMRDAQTIATAITAAETGHLVLSSLHTMGAVETIDRILDVFPGDQQNQVRAQLSKILKGVISQQLIPSKDKKERCLAMEIMMNTPAISNLIREGKVHQIYSQIQMGNKFGMQTMNQALAGLCQLGKIDFQMAKTYSENPEELQEIQESKK